MPPEVERLPGSGCSFQDAGQLIGAAAHAWQEASQTAADSSPCSDISQRRRLGMARAVFHIGATLRAGYSFSKAESGVVKGGFAAERRADSIGGYGGHAGRFEAGSGDVVRQVYMHVEVPVSQLADEDIPETGDHKDSVLSSKAASSVLSSDRLRSQKLHETYSAPGRVKQRLRGGTQTGPIRALGPRHPAPGRLNPTCKCIR